MYVTIKTKNFKTAPTRLKTLKTSLPVANEKTARKLSRILKRRAIKYLEMGASHPDTVTSRMRDKLIVGKAF